MDAEEIFTAHPLEPGLATRRQLLTVLSRTELRKWVRTGRLVRVCHGVYASSLPDVAGRLAALELATGHRLVPCLGTAAGLYGFDTESTSVLHVLDPGARMRPGVGLRVHQRVGAPLRRVDGRLVTAPAWTAVEVARTLWRPRALATLDTAVHIGACTIAELRATVGEHKGRRGIVQVRELLDYVDGRAESPMESEVRLVFLDSVLPAPELQYTIVDRYGDRWRVDFAWPWAHLAAEYDSLQWHMSRAALLHDRLKTARLQECGWTSIPITVDDVRRTPDRLIARVAAHLAATPPADVVA